MERTGAASPVQGVILMVAVSVILASIIAAFALGVAGTVSKAKTVAAVANQEDDDMVVTWHGGPENDYVSYYYVILEDTLVQPDTFPGYQPVVGNTTVFQGLGTDGAAQVVLDTYV